MRQRFAYIHSKVSPEKHSPCPLSGWFYLNHNHIYTFGRNERKKLSKTGRFLYSAVSSPPGCSKGLHFTPWQTCSFQRHLDFSGKHSAMLQLLHEDVSFRISFETAARGFEPRFSWLRAQCSNCYATPPHKTSIPDANMDRHSSNFTSINHKEHYTV